MPYQPLCLPFDDDAPVAPVLAVGRRATPADRSPTRAELRRLPPVIDLVTAARILGIGRTKAYELVRTGRWPTRVLRLDRRIRIPTAALLELLGEARPR